MSTRGREGMGGRSPWARIPGRPPQQCRRQRARCLPAQPLLTVSPPEAKEMDCMWWLAMICQRHVVTGRPPGPGARGQGSRRGTRALGCADAQTRRHMQTRRRTHILTPCQEHPHPIVTTVGRCDGSGCVPPWPLDQAGASASFRINRSHTPLHLPHLWASLV